MMNDNFQKQQHGIDVFIRENKNNEFATHLENNSGKSETINEVEIYCFDIASLGFSPEAVVYAEGYQMLHQTYMKLKDISPQTGTMDKDHYKLKQTEGCFTAYNMLYLEEKDKVVLFGATSCSRFSTEIRISASQIKIVQILENRTIESGASLEAESFAVINGKNRNEVLSDFAGYISSNHPAKKFREIPDGWCSWYCYGPLVTEGAIFKNLKVAKKSFRNLKYIQIDDGYQPHMGDWLMQTKKFRHSMKEICLKIEKAGFEPAMWVAPFIAGEKSALLKHHPDWFIKDDNGQPLSAERVTFKGWRDAPWYFLDPTNPNAVEYIKSVFRIMKFEWHVNYFKLDANCWGALPFGKRYDESKTSVEAYRIGMEAIWEAVGNNPSDTYILGCNAPMWPSLGIVSGMRVSMDIDRKIDAVKGLSKQCFYRNWQNGKLWTNDPDCLVQVGVKAGIISSVTPFIKKNKRIEDEPMYRYASCFVRASGGMVLSGDRLYSLSEYDIGIINKICASERTAAEFNFDYSIGTIKCEHYTDYILFNDQDVTKKITVDVSGEIVDMFTDEKHRAAKTFITELPGNDAAWFRVQKLGGK